MVKIIIAAVIAVVGTSLAIILVRFNRKRLHIIRCAQAATPEQLEAIYSQIDHLGTEVPSCAVLGRTNRRVGTEADWVIPVPSFVAPWGNRVIAGEGGSEVAFRFAAISASEPVLRGQAYRVVPIPRYLTKGGKGRNQFSPSRYVSGNPQLLRTLAAVCPAYPAELLAYLLAGGAETFEFEPMFQVRLGGSPAWVQDAEFPSCEQCKKRMSLILQLPGALLPGKQLPEGTFFFFGCTQHPDRTKTVGQFA